MRVAAWLLVACAMLGAVSLFVPSFELQAHGRISKRAELSLYAAGQRREVMRRMLAGYRSTSHRKLGGEAVRKAAPRAGGRTREALEDVRDAMDTLDGLTDDDVRTAGIGLVAAVWTLVGLEAVLAGLVFVGLVRSGHRRGRLIGALIVAVVVAALASALHVGVQLAAWEANDEVGRNVVALAPGAYLLPAAALLGLVLAIGLVAKRAWRAPAS